MPDIHAALTAAATRELFARYDGPVHPDDLAAARHGGVAALRRRRVQDRAAIVEGLLLAALQAMRRLRDRRDQRAEAAARRRLDRLHAAALAWRTAVDGATEPNG